ncbi:MAG: integrase [Bacteroidetes bacterium]|jgi:integrase|nr:integrase [Bacteroidota bacterium]
MKKKKDISFRYELNPRPNREGVHEILLVITENGKKQRVKTEIYCKNEHFGTVVTKGNNSKRVVIPQKWVNNKDKENAYKNKELDDKLTDYKSTYKAKKESQPNIKKEFLVKAVKDGTVKKDVLSIFQKMIDELNADDNYPTEKGFITTKGHFAGFLEKEGLPVTTEFEDMDKNTLKSFEKYLFKVINGDEPASDSSVHTNMKRLRRINNYAIEDLEIITSDIYPFKSYTMPVIVEKYKERLTQDELELFENEPYEPYTAKFNVQKAFMFSVRLAGLRVEDTISMRVKNILNGRITYNMKKGSTGFTLKSYKITPKIQATLDLYVKPNSKPDDLIFPFLPPAVFTFTKREFKKEIGRKTSYINSLLKEIADDACISKKITTHIGRHSFASAVQKSTNDIETISKALGHKDIKVTQRYLEELNVESLDGMMDKLDI